MYFLPPFFTNTGFAAHLHADLCDSLRAVDVTLLSVQVTDTKSTWAYAAHTLQLIQACLKYLQICHFMDLQQVTWIALQLNAAFERWKGNSGDKL